VRSSFSQFVERIASGGITREESDRLIARSERGGASRARRTELQRLVAADGFARGSPRKRGPDNFVGHSRDRIADYLRYLESIEKPAPRKAPAGSVAIGTLFGPGDADVSQQRYTDNVAILAGEKPATMPGGRAITFVDRYVDSPTHQLHECAEWLAAYARRLGFQVELEAVPYKGKVYHNVIVTVPGDSPEYVSALLHYDTADHETGMRRNDRQLSRDHGLSKKEIAELAAKTPLGMPAAGADDNGSGVAAGLEILELYAAQLKKGVRFEKTTKIVFTALEEMPGDCLGARVNLDNAQKRNDAVDSVWVLDMVGVPQKGSNRFQIAVARNPKSMELAASVERAVQRLGRRIDLRADYRPFRSLLSYGHQTDLEPASRLGYAGLLLNEPINERHNFWRKGYHDPYDVSRLMNFKYASDITRVWAEAMFERALPYRRGA
jgi:hypothetical protein